MKKLSKRWAVRVISFSIAVSLVFLGAGISGYMLAVQYKSTIENTYQQAINELTGYVDDIMDTLKKGMYSNTPSQQAFLATKLLSESAAAKQAVGRLPLSQKNVDSLQKFLSQSSDVAAYIINKLSHNESISDDDIETLSTLKDYTDMLSKSLHELAWKYGDGSVQLEQMNYITGNLSDVSEKISQCALTDGFNSINESFVDYPSLLYDGPFADHVVQRKPLSLANADTLTEDQAAKAAAEFLNLDEDSVSLSAERAGNLPSYLFEYDGSTISVTKQGGKIDYFYKSVNPQHIKISTDEACNRATDFLNEHGYNHMQKSYYSISNGICTVNFALHENGITYYSDLVKVSVDMENGDICACNMTGYIMNHYERSAISPTLTAEEAAQSLSSSLTVEGDATSAMIPLSNGKEVLCYEYKCVSDSGEQFLIYVNADTGLEENIYLLMISDDGTLVV